MSAKDDYVNQLRDDLIRAEAEKQALVAEFRETVNKEETLTADGLRAAIDKMLPHALQTMQELLIASESDTLRWSIAKFAISSKLTDGKDAEGADVFESLMKQLIKQ